MPKKKWIKPKLVVLIRGSSAEMVLTACKGGGGGAPYTADGGCAGIMNRECEACQDSDPS